jgi:maltose O-acetyltransferase
MTIGDRAVVGANAVVTEYAPADTVVAGNPARIVKELNSLRAGDRKWALSASE